MENTHLVKLVLIGFLFLCHSLGMMAQKKTYLNPKDAMDLNYEKFDMDFYNQHKDDTGYLYYEGVKEDKTKVGIIASETFSDIQQTESLYPHYFTRIKFFYKNGNLKEKGILLGQQCKIDKWLICDESGNCKIEDYERNRGRFGYNDVLRFLEKKKFINPKKGIGSECFGIEYNYENNYWVVSGTHNETLWTVYRLDGDNGRILKEFQPPIIF